MFQLHVVNQHYAVQMHQRSEIRRSDGLLLIGLVLTFWKKAETLSCRCRYDRRYMTGYVCLLKCMKLQSMHTGDILCHFCVDFIESFFFEWLRLLSSSIMFQKRFSKIIHRIRRSLLIGFCDLSIVLPALRIHYSRRQLILYIPVIFLPKYIILPEAI